MIPSWSPDAWNSFGVVGFAVLVTVFLFTALVRGWVVMGKYHEEVVAAKDEAIAQLHARAEKDATSIDKLSAAITEKNATEDATTKILSAIRETVGGVG